MLISVFQKDDISGLHVNTHLPVIIGTQKRYEVVGDHLYKVNEKLFLLYQHDWYCALSCLTVQAVEKLIRNVLFLYNLSY
jgi:hypothetical protein